MDSRWTGIKSSAKAFDEHFVKSFASCLKKATSSWIGHP